MSTSALRSKFGAVVLVGCLVSIGGLIGTPAPVSAISDGQSPATCGSPTTARAQTARDYYGNIAGWIDLRFSSSCPGSPSRATWARATNSNGVTCIPAVQGCGTATVHRNGSSISTCYYASGSTSCYSGAARDVGSSSAYAEGWAEGTPLGGHAATASFSY